MRLRPEEIYLYARHAGFSPDQAVTMTAIALAESGGETLAHNAVGEDSVGLWQVNLAAHPQFAGLDPTDPLTNARMAYEVSGAGADIGRWTVTHLDRGARYLQFREQAEAAARAAGEDAVGQWTPPQNYHSTPIGAGAGGGDPAPPLASLGRDTAPEDALGADPAESGTDTDADGLVDAYERHAGTDPTLADTDRDGFADATEIIDHGTDPLDFADNPLTPTGAEPGFRPSGSGDGEPPPPEPRPLEARPVGGAPVTSQPLETFIDAALSQQGDPYIFGAEVELRDLDPASFDCSELVQWAAAQAGVDIQDGSFNQYLQLKGMGAQLPVSEALRTPGALVFSFSSEPVPGGGRPAGAHVAISLGDGRLMEARGRRYGVGVFEASDRTFTHAAYIPDLGSELVAAELAGEGIVAGDLPFAADSDGDGLLDAYERLIATDPFSADTDRDGFIDRVEIVDHLTDPLDFADTPLDAGTGMAPPYRPPLTTDLGSRAPMVASDRSDPLRPSRLADVEDVTGPVGPPTPTPPPPQEPPEITPDDRPAEDVPPTPVELDIPVDPADDDVDLDTNGMEPLEDDEDDDLG